MLKCLQVGMSGKGLRIMTHPVRVEVTWRNDITVGMAWGRADAADMMSDSPVSGSYHMPSGICLAGAFKPGVKQPAVRHRRRAPPTVFFIGILGLTSAPQSLCQKYVAAQEHLGLYWHVRCACGYVLSRYTYFIAVFVRRVAGQKNEPGT